jgi:hypothetical protein
LDCSRVKDLRENKAWLELEFSSATAAAT